MAAGTRDWDMGTGCAPRARNMGDQIEDGWTRYFMPRKSAGERIGLVP
jgi:hypothetical protein